MNLRDLKYLVALAEHQHFGKAAAACFVSQPTLSMQIKKLEETLGVTLIERNNKAMLLTPIGKEISQHAQLLLQQVTDMQSLAQAARDPYSGKLTIGIIPTLAPYLLPYIIPALSKAYPRLTIYLIEEQTAKITEKLKYGELDAIILALPIEQNDLSVTHLFNEEFLLAVPPSHGLAKRKSIKQNELSGQTLLLLEEGHCLRDQALDICHSVSASVDQHFRATSLETLRHMVAVNAGITLIPKLAARDDNKEIIYIPFATPKPKREIGLLTRRSTTKKIVLDEIANTIKEMMKQVL